MPLATWAQSDDFADGNGTGWTRYDPLGGLGAPATYSFPSGGYRIQAAVSPNPGVLGPGRAGSLREDVTYTDFQISYDLIDWNNTLDQAFGVMARVNNATLGDTDGYAFTYSTDGSINLSEIANESPSGLDSASITLNPANDYRFWFTGVGGSLTGVVYDLADLTTPLATVTASDATYASGVSGLLVFDNSATGTGATDATFDNYVALVPEPSTLGLLALASLVLGLGIRRARNSRA